VLLSDYDIEKLHSDCPDLIVPWQDDSLQPASYDMSLGDEIIRPDYGQVWPKARKVEHVESSRVSIDCSQGYRLLPKEFVLGTTKETVHVPDSIGARFEGKSSLGRIGLMTHVTAGFIDPGFNGTITVEICNVSDSIVYLESGMKIGQICFYELKTRSNKPYGKRGNHYQDQNGVTQAYLTDVIRS
jgi:dCTP deaminase